MERVQPSGHRFDASHRPPVSTRRSRTQVGHESTSRFRRRRRHWCPRGRTGAHQVLSRKETMSIWSKSGAKRATRSCCTSCRLTVHRAGTIIREGCDVGGSRIQSQALPLTGRGMMRTAAPGVPAGETRRAARSARGGPSESPDGRHLHLRLRAACMRAKCATELFINLANGNRRTLLRTMPSRAQSRSRLGRCGFTKAFRAARGTRYPIQFRAERSRSVSPNPRNLTFAAPPC
jgi:hypothetical protein